MATNTTFFLIDEYVTTAPGKPFRLFPFGRIIKKGKVVDLTPEMARKFTLPHFKPPIKLGSHKEDAPAGGFIVGLEVRLDGLYAIPEYNEQGQGATERGDYRYQSPEVVWEGIWGENAMTGGKLEGPMIVGAALLHNPALGEAAALYSVKPFDETGVETMAEDTQNMVPLSLVEKLWDKFSVKAQTEPAPAKPEPEDRPAAVTVEQYTADITARDETIANLKTRIETMEAENAERQRRAHFAAELVETPYAADSDFITVLTGLTDEQAASVVERIRALSAQADMGLTAEVGGQGHGSAVDAFSAAIEDYRKEHPEVTYNQAVTAVSKRSPDMAAAALNGGVA